VGILLSDMFWLSVGVLSFKNKELKLGIVEYVEFRMKKIKEELKELKIDL